MQRLLLTRVDSLLILRSPSSSSSLPPSLLLSFLLRCAYNTAFQSRTSLTRSSLRRYSSTFVGRAGSYTSSQSVSRWASSRCFFFLRRPPRCRFSPAPTPAYRYSSSSVAAQSARVLRGWAGAAAAGFAVVVDVDVAEAEDGVAAGGALGKAGFGLAGCLTWGRRMGWKRRAGSIALFAGVSSLEASLNMTGPREMEALLSVSRRLAYSDMPPRCGGCGGGAAMSNGCLGC